MSDNTLSMWTVYDHPSDLPHNFVARRFEVDAAGAVGTSDVLIAPNLRALRACLASRGLTPLCRAESDDPVIVETWL